MDGGRLRSGGWYSERLRSGEKSRSGGLELRSDEWELRSDE